MISHPVEAQSGFTEPSTSLPSLLPVSVLPDFCVLHPVCSVALFAFLLPVSPCTLIIRSFFFKRKKKLCSWGPAGHPAASTLRFPRRLGCRASLWQDAGGTATPQGSVRVFLVQVSALRCLPSQRIRTAWFGRDLKVHPVPTPSDMEEHRTGLCRAAVTCQTGLGAFLCAAEASSARGPAPKPRGAAYLGCWPAAEENAIKSLCLVGPKCSRGAVGVQAWLLLPLPGLAAAQLQTFGSNPCINQKHEVETCAASLPS